jgi:hypothetical protein
MGSQDLKLLSPLHDQSRMPIEIIEKIGPFWKKSA